MSDSQRATVKIYLLSPRNLSSELLAHALEREVNATCEILPALNDFTESFKPKPDGLAYFKVRKIKLKFE